MQEKGGAGAETRWWENAPLPPRPLETRGLGKASEAGARAVGWLTGGPGEVGLHQHVQVCLCCKSNGKPLQGEGRR